MLLLEVFQFALLLVEQLKSLGGVFPEIAQCNVDLCMMKFNPFTPSKDQNRVSPYNINTISSRQAMGV